MDKVHGGTPRGNSTESMCKSCRNARVTRGVNNQELIFCMIGHGIRIHFPVTECSVYDNKGQPPLYEMQNIAWVIHSRNRGPIGFAGEGRTELVIDPPGQQSPSQPATEYDNREI
jgi:hypothetical protein